MAWTAARKRRGGSGILSKPSAMTLAASITFQKAKSSLSGVRATLSIMAEAMEADAVRNMAFDGEAYGVLLEALDDEHLFKPHFVGESWNGWKGFLAALVALPAPDWHRRGLWRLYGPRKAAWCAIYGSGSYRRQARRQIPHIGFSRCIPCRLPRLRPAPCRWRACDDCGARGEPVTGAKHFQVCFGFAERGPAVRANDP
jgi:hypothetical protein